MVARVNSGDPFNVVGRRIHVSIVPQIVILLGRVVGLQVPHLGDIVLLRDLRGIQTANRVVHYGHVLRAERRRKLPLRVVGAEELARTTGLAHRLRFLAVQGGVR